MSYAPIHATDMNEVETVLGVSPVVSGVIDLKCDICRDKMRLDRRQVKANDTG